MDNEFAVVVGILTTQEINVTREGACFIGEGDAPNASELDAGISMGGVVALEELFVHELHGVSFGEVGAVSVPSRTDEG